MYLKILLFEAIYRDSLHQIDVIIERVMLFSRLLYDCHTIKMTWQ
jgi:hypothetical protein